MISIRDDVLVGRLPESVRGAAGKAGVGEADCLFAVRADLDLDGASRDVWLVVSPKGAVAVSADDGEAASPFFPKEEIEKVQILQTVGSAVLRFRLDGAFVDAVRFTNGRREIFNRAAAEIERLVAGKDVRAESLTRPSERVCPECGLPLSAKGVVCPRCRGGHGIAVRALGLMLPYWRSGLAVFVLLLVRVSLNLVPPFLISVLVDRVLNPRANADWLIWFVAGLLAVAAVLCVINVTLGRMSSSIGARIGRELRQKLQARLLELDVEYFDRHAVGSLMSRVLYDVEYFQGFVNQVAEGFLLNLMMVVGIGAMLFYMNWQLALLVMLPIPFVIGGTVFLWRHVWPKYYPVWESQSKMAQLVSGELSGIRMVKAFGQERRERDRFGESAIYMESSRVALQSTVATFNPIMGFFFGLGGLIIWYSGGRQVLAGVISLGILMAFLGYVGMFYGPVQSLSMFSNWMTGFVSAGQRVFEILDAAPTCVTPANGEPPPPAGDACVEFRNVTFGYDPFSPVLKDVSLRIEPGQFIGVVGKSGSGKTTLVNLICRFYDAQQGTVLLDGVNVRRVPPEELRSRVALVLQEPFLFRASIRDNIAYGRPDAGPAEVIDAARAANAHEFVSRMPLAYDAKVGERGAGLSGGERQRITIARAILRDPKLLILDEATSSVDTQSEQMIQTALTEVRKGRTLIVIAHRLSTLKNADRIVVVDEGRIVEAGAHEELMELDGLYAKLVRIQTELTRIEVD